MSKFFGFPLSGDILRGAAEISKFLFGEKNRKRKVYYLAARDILPVFRVGSMLCARKSALTDWFAGMECSCSPKLGAPSVQNVSEVL
jgi:hypothetical protein